jgi:type IV secretory pathway VirB10-like protein
VNEPNSNSPATVPDQPEPKLPLRKGMPVVIGLIVLVVLIGIANVSSLIGGKKKTGQANPMPIRPAAPNAQQVNSFETQQQTQAVRDQEERQRQQEIAAAMQQINAAEGTPGPESTATPPMTAAQRSAIYGDSANGPQRTSGMSEAQAEAKQKALAKQKQEQDAIGSGTVAIDFEKSGGASGLPAPAPLQASVPANHEVRPPNSSTGEPDALSADSVVDRGAGIEGVSAQSSKPENKSDPMAEYSFDDYQGQLYRVFEGTVLEGVVTNHIDGGFSGPVLIMLTTDYYSHDHQQLLMPQGTRLLGTVQSVGNVQQRKMFVTFHRAVCPDGFSLDFDKYIGLDPLGTTGLATKVDHGYLLAFGAAAAIGGLGGLAQIGNNSSILDPSTQIRNGISAQSSQEAEQILNHFLNRLPVITLKEGSRARVYIGRDILIPSYAEHRVTPTL